MAVTTLMGCVGYLKRTRELAPEESFPGSDRRLMDASLFLRARRARGDTRTTAYCRVRIALALICGEGTIAGMLCARESIEPEGVASSYRESFRAPLRACATQKRAM